MRVFSKTNNLNEKGTRHTRKGRNKQMIFALENLEERCMMSITVPASGLLLDFGNPTSPVAVGALNVTPVPYSASSGYGWMGPVSADARSIATNPSPLLSDAQKAIDQTFQVDVAPGVYNVTLYLGDDALARDNVSIYLQNTLVASNLGTTAGQHIQPVYTTTVTNGALKLRLLDSGGITPLWAINAMKVVTVSTSGTAAVSGHGVPMTITTIDDSTRGSGYNQFNYSGSWVTATQNTIPTVVMNSYLATNTYITTTNSRTSILFNGTSINLIGTVSPDNGIAAVSIDGGTETRIDEYAGSASGNIVLYKSPSLAVGTHTLTVRATGLKNTLSSGIKVGIDRADVYAPNGTSPDPTKQFAFAGSNQAAPEGSVVQFEGNATGSGTLSYLWSFGDGSSATGTLQPKHSYADNGLYTVTLKVTDSSGTSITGVCYVSVSNVAPWVTLPGTIYGGIAKAITFNATVTDASPIDQAAGFQYLWSFGDGTTSILATPSHTYSTSGLFLVKLTVTDKNGGANSIAGEAWVSPQVNAGTAITTSEGTSIAFKGSAIGGNAVTYKWSFGDGTNASGSLNPSHTYTDNGQYNAILSATDQFGLQVSSSVIVTVGNVSPTAQLSSSVGGIAGTALPLSATATDPSTIDTAAGFTFNWGFGDGTSGVGELVSHTYILAGSYQISVTATDKDGGVSRPVTKTIIISSNQSLTVGGMTAQTINEGAVATFTDTVSGGIAPYTYAWTFGDGVSSNGQLTVNHFYSDNGSYTARLTATDAKGTVASNSLKVTVLNVIPTVSIGGPYTGTLGTPIALSATATDPSTVDTVAGFTFNWNFGDGTIGTGVNVSHSYSTSGTFSASVTATDKDGGASVKAVSSVNITALTTLPSITVSAGTNQSTIEGAAVTLNGSVSRGTGPFTYFWNYGDGTMDAGTLSQTHTYTDNGIYTAFLTVIDSTGLSGTSTAVITVANVVPTIENINVLRTANVGASVNFMATASDPSITDYYAGFTYNWNFGDGKKITTVTRTVQHTYTVAGSYTSSLTVTDKDGGTSTAQTFPLVVTNATVIPIDAAWLQANSPAPYILDQPGATYKLMTDVVTTGTAFQIKTNGVVFDLNGHTVTYDNASPIVVNNGGFEAGSLTGWNVLAAPHASVIPQSMMWGNYMAQVGPITGTETMTSSPVSIPLANMSYFASLTCHGHYGSNVTLSVIDTVTGSVLATNSADPGHGGGLSVTFVPTTIDPLSLKVDLSPGTNASDSIQLDYVQLTRMDNYGVDFSYKLNTTVTSSVPGGTITQGQSRGFASYPINAYNASNVVVTNVTANFSGTDTCGIYGDYINNSYVANCTFRGNVDQIMNRMALMSVIYMLQSLGSNDIENNLLSGSIQGGIVVDRANGLIVTGNVIKLTSMWTDGYGIETGGGVRYYDIGSNTIIPVKGRGILIDDYLNSAMSKNGFIHDNYVETQEGGDLEYGTSGLEVTALRIRSGFGLIQNLHVLNNTFYAHTQIGLDHTAIGCRITLYNNSANMNILLQGNQFKALILNQDAGINNAFGLSLSAIASGTGLTLIGNTFESNNVSLNLGDNDGINESDVHFFGNTITKSSGGISMPYTGIQSAYWISTLDNISMIDTVYQNGAIPGISYGGTGVKNASFGSLLNLAIQNSSGTGITGATVTIFNSLNQIVFTGNSDSSGSLSAIPLLTTTYRQLTIDPTQIITDNLSPFTIHVTSGTNMATVSLTLTSDLSRTILLN